jgi:hypothetical protein
MRRTSGDQLDAEPEPVGKEEVREVRVLLALLKLAVAAHRHAEQPRGPRDRQAEPLPILAHHLAVRGGHLLRRLTDEDDPDGMHRSVARADDAERDARL